MTESEFVILKDRVVALEVELEKLRKEVVRFKTNTPYLYPTNVSVKYPRYWEGSSETLNANKDNN